MTAPLAAPASRRGISPAPRAAGPRRGTPSAPLASAVPLVAASPPSTTTAVAAAALAGWLLVAALLLARRRRAELVARAIHEIAGPLNAAGLALHAARRDRAAGARLAAIDVELRRAGRALEDLDAARAGRRVRDRARVVDVGALVAQQALAWQSFARARGASLHVAAGPGLVVRADAVRLAQAVGNLVANAIEHGGEHVELRAASVGERVRVEVRDDGPGLPAPVSALARRARGGRGRRGRGLAIAADIASRHGGRLAAAPASTGARLVLDLPALSRRPAPPEARTEEHGVVAPRPTPLTPSDGGAAA
ncbi:MAG TPA: sensor histidine kinase [Solirubrobacteraceae bacterium]|jgi:signal transduction histidine kinase